MKASQKYLKFSLLLCSLSLLSLQPAHADCMITALTDDDINICQHKITKQTEYVLNEIEEKIRKHLSGTQKDRFNAAQGLWRDMAERDCEIESDFYEGAGIYQAIYSVCMNNHYNNRIMQISNYLCPDHSLGKGCEKAEEYKNKITAMKAEAEKQN
jgi:uncharacterized protein YecT (DUF1311 family)